ncbi:MAG TPA: hypothetical protein VG797_01390, partial [Phycisphaerales bacterium]|nr:hypothetical protein [Phycisphaerales bacterium]
MSTRHEAEWSTTAAGAVLDALADDKGGGPEWLHLFVMQRQEGHPTWSARSAGTATTRMVPDALLVSSDMLFQAPRVVDDTACGMWRRMPAEIRPAALPSMTERDLTGCACARAPTADTAEREIVLVAGGTPDARPLNDTELMTLGVLAGEVSCTYEAGFIRLEMIRTWLLQPLTPAQRVVVPLLAGGESEAAVAQRLCRSVHTVHEHVKEIYRAWNVNGRYEMRLLWNGLLREEGMG